MGKLNQVVAVVAAKKKLATEAITQAYHTIQKPELFQGIVRVYTPRDEEGERFPPERKVAQTSVPMLVDAVRKPLVEMFDIVLTQDVANTEVNCAVAVDGFCIHPAVPVTDLLFLEKQMTDMIAFVSKLPVLDPSETWHWDENSNSYVSEPSESVKSKKIPRAFVKYEATKEHPAQVEMFTEDVVVGNWKTVKFCGAIPASEKAAMIDRARKLKEAIIKAREACNSNDVKEQRIGEAIVDFVFKGQ